MSSTIEMPAARSACRDIPPADRLAARGKARLIDVREICKLAADGFIEGFEHVSFVSHP